LVLFSCFTLLTAAKNNPSQYPIIAHLAFRPATKGAIKIIFYYNSFVSICFLLYLDKIVYSPVATTEIPGKLFGTPLFVNLEAALPFTAHYCQLFKLQVSILLYFVCWFFPEVGSLTSFQNIILLHAC